MAFSRTINIRANNLGKHATLIFTFDTQNMQGIYRDYFPTAWKVTAFGATGGYTFSTKYVSQLGVTRAQTQNGVVIPASTYTPIDVGMQTNLTESSGIYSFSPPESFQPDTHFKVTNSTNGVENIGIGFFSDGPDREPSTTLFFNGVGRTSSVIADFTPTLAAYIAADYQENEIIRGEVSSPVIWKQNLAGLSETSNWVLLYDPTTGVFNIEPEV